MAVLPGNREPLDALTRRFRPGALRRDRFALEETARKIAAHGEAGITFLLQNVADGDADRVAAIFVGLAFAPKTALRKHRTAIRKALMAHIHDPRDLVAAEAIDALRLLNFADAGAEVVSALSHPSPYVVGSVLRFLSRLDPEVAKPHLLQALKSPSPIVRQNAVDELDELECKEALSAIRPLLHDADEDVRQAAQTALENLTELHDGRLAAGKQPRSRRPA